MIIVGMLLGLIAVTLYQTAYDQFVQRPLCFAYATAHQYPDTTSLAFNGVTLATGRSPEHACRFRNIRTGAMSELTFADTPYLIDTVDVFGMVLAFLLGGISVIRWYPNVGRGTSEVGGPRR